MKILLFMDVYIFGGCEKMLKETSEYLLSKGHEVDLLLIYKSEDNTYLQMLDNRINVKYIWNVDKRSKFIKRVVYWINVLFPQIVSRYVEISGYDIIINFKDDYQTNIIASQFNCKKISWVHNITEEYQPITKKGVKYKIADRVYRKIDEKYVNSFSMFDRVVFVSEHAKSALKRKCKKVFDDIVIYNYVNIPVITKLSKEKIFDYVFDKFTFCYVGRLSAEKGVREIVEVVCRLIKNGYDVNLIIIGEGYQLSELEQLVVENKCESNIYFLGTKINPYPYIKQSNVILCGSHKESFGLVVLESIILKKWVISMRCGGPEELIDNGVNGDLVSDYCAMYEKMEMLYKKLNIQVKDSDMLDYKNLQNMFYEKVDFLLKDKKEDE